MRLELRNEGYTDVQFVAINAIDALDDRKELSDRCSFPLFQDTEEVNGWDMHDANKDDMIIYDRDGKVAVYLPVSGGPSTSLTSEEGYEYVKGRLLEVIEQ